MNFWEQEIEAVRRSSEARIEELMTDLETTERQVERLRWVVDQAHSFLADDSFAPLTVPELLAEVEELIDRLEAQKDLTETQAKKVRAGIYDIRHGYRTGARHTKTRRA